MDNEEKIYTLEELQKKLTEKESRFCHFYIQDWNGRGSAIKAGYSENTASEIAYEYLRKPHIKQYIEFIKDDIAKEAKISKLSLINELKLIAFSNLPIIAHKYADGGIDALDEDEQKAILELVDNKKTLGEGGAIIDSQKKIKLHDKRAAIQDILKAMGWNEPDKIDHSSKDGSMSPKETNYSNVSTETLKKFREEANGNKS